MSPRRESDPDVRRGRAVVCRLHAHVVFIPRYRRKVFTDEMRRRCEAIMIEVCDDFGAVLVEFNGEHDHVHPLVRHPPKVALPVLVNSLKGVSARLLRKEFGPHVRQYLWGGRFWSPSSCGGASLSIVKEYVEHRNGRTDPLT
ncbi:IS200/IS605 family transposase [Streptosporangium sp. NPDC023825]|uniref:IS200/IS605 family transposase n=1 Tax=Streptosporangium sp. NPDC023825 TaxID=3154909 RepID=UPI0034348D67